LIHIEANNLPNPTFQVVNYVIHIEANKELIGAAVSMLGQRLTAANQPNYRYLSLELMQRMCHIPEASRQFRQHQKIVSKALNDGDVSLRRRALDVLYSMCDCQNSAKV
jgi:AP-2 complex subunit alpha